MGGVAHWVAGGVQASVSLGYKCSGDNGSSGSGSVGGGGGEGRGVGWGGEEWGGEERSGTGRGKARPLACVRRRGYGQSRDGVRGARREGRGMRYRRLER